MAFSTTTWPSARARTNEIDERARGLVREYFSAQKSGTASAQDEADLRLRLAGLAAEAGIPEQVAVSFVNRKGLSSDLVTDLVSRLQIYLCDDVQRKLQLHYLLSKSFCGWARQLLFKQVGTALRSEWRARRAKPVEDVSMPEPPHRPGVRQLVVAARPETTDELEDIVAEEFVLGAKKACSRENQPHLAEYILRRKFGFRSPARNTPRQLSLAPFAERASELLSKTDREALPPIVVEAIASSVRSLRHDPQPAVVDMFLLLVAGRVASRRRARQLALAWVAQWTETKNGKPKSQGRRALDRSRWDTVSAAAVEAHLLGARSLTELNEAIEHFFWAAHYQVGNRSKRVA